MDSSLHKTKIAFISDAIWPYNKGGKEKRLFDIATRLSKAGLDVHVYTMKWWPGPRKINNNRITLHAICNLHPLYSGSRRSIKESVFFALSCFKLIFEDWDIVDVDHMPFFPLYSMKIVCLLKGKKMIATWHEVWGNDYWLKYMGKLGFISSLIEKFSVLLPDEIISISSHTTKQLRGKLGSQKEITTIPVGIDIKHINSVRPSPIKTDVIYAGRLLSHKNVDVLIKSISLLKKLHPEIKCLIIGDGPEKNQLIQLCSDLKLNKNIKFFGFVKDIDTVYSLMKSSKVFVFPSNREGFGIVTIEANACGIPVITTNHQDNASKDLITAEENGYLCNLDEYEIANSISQKILRNSNKNLKHMCLSHATKYNWNRIISKVQDIYQK